MKSKVLVSLLMAFCAVPAAVSGVVLFLAPRGRVAHWTDWTVLGLDRHQWIALHINMCFLLLLLAAVHLGLNWKSFWCYVRGKVSGMRSGWAIVIAVVVIAAMVAGTVVEVPPLSWLPSLRYQLRAYWEQGSAPGPVPHAEELTLSGLADRLGLGGQQLIDALKQDGYQVEDPDVTLATLAEQNGVAAGDLYEALGRHFPDAIKNFRPGRGRGSGWRGGQGRGAGQRRGRQFHGGSGD